MLIAACCIGLLCAYHFGLRIGIIGAGVTLVLFVAALVMPTYALHIYAAVALGVAGVCVVGPRVASDEARPVKRSLRMIFKLGRRLVDQARGKSR